MKLLYFAHSMSDYGSDLEASTQLYLASCPAFEGMPVVNPNNPRHSRGFQTEGMEHFDNVILPHLGACVFMAFPDGKLGSGVVYEIRACLAKGIPCYEIERSGLGLTQVDADVLNDRALTRLETREYLRRYDLWTSLLAKK